jgi:hypothetical protein
MTFNEVNAVLLDATDAFCLQSSLFHVHNTLSFEPDLFYTRCRWNQLTSGQWSLNVDCLQCKPLSHRSLASLVIGCKHSWDRKIERSLRLHLSAPEAWDDELSSVQFDVLDSIHLWNLIAQPELRPFPTASLTLKSIEMLTPQMSSAKTSQLITLLHQLSVTSDQVNGLKNFIKQSATMLKLLSASGETARSPADVGKLHNHRQWQALLVNDDQLTKQGWVSQKVKRSLINSISSEQIQG